MQAMLLVGFLTSYLVSLAGNMVIIGLIRLDSCLHTPMYFFLSSLSFLDICYASSIVPHMLFSLASGHWTISYAGCKAQMFVALTCGITECMMLALMAYDRYVAVCLPLRYMTIMNHTACQVLVAFAWLVSLMLSVVPVFGLPMPFCGPNEVDHFFCEVPAVMQLACANMSFSETVMFGRDIFTLFIPFSFILATYGRIAITILRIHSNQGRRKAFSTCTSHLTAVTLFYGTAIFMYMRPRASRSPAQNKMAAVFYTVVTPMMNPLIYSLRNKEVKGAMSKVINLGRNMFSRMA
ncbi:olfactory receptor 2G3-like [Alligator mississippiensis]|uniref:Olfactory receptor n=3 Tax=Alligator mississippiensis TaxID=8496 RepID=A0A151NWA3_ALLMI|nr:olfactory receptor 2G3-like [Alligator mississippiensis]